MFYIVGVTATCKRLAVCANEDDAAAYIDSLPFPEDGIYYIDECDSTVELAEMTLDDLPDLLHMADDFDGGEFQLQGERESHLRQITERKM